MGRLERAH
jgi:hypothetical protein